MSEDKPFEKCLGGKGCKWCNDTTKGKERWFANYLENKKIIIGYGTKTLTPCICIVFKSNIAPVKLEKNKAMQAWRQYKNRKKDTTKVQTNYTLTKETIKILKQSAIQENRPLNLELEIIINTYVKMKAEGKLDHEISKIVLSNLITAQNID
ncbi:hypothetical protein [Pseudoalteromonas sp. SG44-17]|uniref:hypothetical protein n=1 Tax=Pseudoalteromonas sp. SG44-17 TaxID=2760963 RepID=UPI0016007F23|nr:hypothetical protein [Pseudoalteromonas sp. SG44-17]MBB1410565.1 hypothetical protein [Pseudoalteromonas sp. SG44-17]